MFHTWFLSSCEMDTHKKPANPTRHIKPKPDEEFMANKYSEIYETILLRMTTYKLRQASCGRFRYNWERILAWRSKLAKSIMHVTYQFL